MRPKSKIVMTGILLVALILACIPSSVYGALYGYGAESELFSCYKGMTEDEIYNLKKNDTADDLIMEIIDLEKALPQMDDKIAILPHLTALVDKGDEFTEDELIELIKRSDTDVGLDSAFIKMYVHKGADVSKLLLLLEDESIDPATKEYIVSKGDFSKNELCEIFQSNKDTTAVIAMKKLAVLDEDLAYELAVPILTISDNQATSEQYISACLGIAQYYENHKLSSEEDRDGFLKMKESAITELKKLYDTSTDELVKNHAIYALARMADDEVFKYIIESEEIDFYLKVTTIERNVPLMVSAVRKASSMEEIQTVIDAMKLHPITEVGQALSKAVSSEILPKTQEIEEVIEYIKKEGIGGVDKYEK